MVWDSVSLASFPLQWCLLVFQWAYFSFIILTFIFRSNSFQENLGCRPTDESEKGYQFLLCIVRHDLLSCSPAYFFLTELIQICGTPMFWACGPLQPLPLSQRDTVNFLEALCRSVEVKSCFQPNTVFCSASWKPSALFPRKHSSVLTEWFAKGEKCSRRGSHMSAIYWLFLWQQLISFLCRCTQRLTCTDVLLLAKAFCMVHVLDAPLVVLSLPGSPEYSL